MCNDFIEENDVKIQKTETVFYNPAQKFNRDLTISVINEYIKDVKNPTIFEAMSATGLRGIRFIKEIEKNCNIYLNDYDHTAVQNIIGNIKLNNIDTEEQNETLDSLTKFKASITNNEITKNVFVTQENCNSALYRNRNKFDVIDIDPFGCSTPYIESAIANIRHNGLLCVTSTDTGVLCSNKKKCYIKYNALIAKTPAHHEQSIRVLLGYIAKCAGKYGKSIKPIISLTVDFYVRIFVIVSNNKRNKTFEDLSYYLYCDCMYFREITITKNKTESKCDNCGNAKMSLIGPLYNKSIKDDAFIDKMDITDTKRIKTILTILRRELDTFLFYVIPEMARYLKKCCIPLKMLLNGVHNNGYIASFTHCENNSIKTNAPVQLLYQLINDYTSDPNNEIFAMHEKTLQLMSREYKLDIVSSGMGPLSLPKK